MTHLYGLAFRGNLAVDKSRTEGSKGNKESGARDIMMLAQRQFAKRRNLEQKEAKETKDRVHATS